MGRVERDSGESAIASRVHPRPNDATRIRDRLRATQGRHGKLRKNGGGVYTSDGRRSWSTDDDDDDGPMPRRGLRGVRCVSVMLSATT